jgi:thioredoxin-like negative regulator of GroEL
MFAAPRAAADSPAEIESAADAYGQAVSKARTSNAGIDALRKLLETGAALQRRVSAQRSALEGAAGQDDAALERLYRSTDWQRLDYAEVTAGYWSAWAEVSVAQRLPAGSAERKAALTRAQKGFARASLELRLPGVASSSLLGLGIVKHELGDLDGAREALQAVEKALADQPPTPLLGAVRYELAVIALQQGDLERAHALGDAIPAGSLTHEQELALLRDEAEAWLKRARAGKGGADRAAALLRRLSASGSDGSRAASALAVAYRTELRGQDLGPIGKLLAAESAFAEKRYAEARDAYAQVLADPAALPGIDLEATRYRYAASLAETGDRGSALGELEKLFAGAGPGRALREPAARLDYSLAAQAAQEDPSPANETRAVRAAERLLAWAPGAPEAGQARYRVAHAKETSGKGGASVPLLEQIPESSPAYPAARVDLVRARAEALQQEQNAGRAMGAESRERARKLAADIDIVERLAAAGRLPADPSRDATLAVLRAKAAAWAGDPPAAVLERVERASHEPGLDAADRRSLLRLRLAALRAEGRWKELDALFTSTDNAALRGDLPIWSEAFRSLGSAEGPAPPGELVEHWGSRLSPLAPPDARDALALAEVEALLRAGRAADAADRAHGLLERSPDWGDAWLAYARALDQTPQAKEAAAAWQRVAGGVPKGSALWLEAELAYVRAVRRAGDAEAACRALETVRRTAPDLGGARLRPRFEAEAKGCPPAAAPGARP